MGVKSGYQSLLSDQLVETKIFDKSSKIHVAINTYFDARYGCTKYGKI